MYFDRIHKFIKYQKKSNIIIASGKFPIWICGFCSIFFKKKYISIIHGSEVNFNNKLKQKIIDYFLKKFDSIIAVSNFTKSIVEKRGIKNVNVIHNGYNIEEPNFEHNIQISGFPKLITVGSMSNRKVKKNKTYHI